MVYTFEIGCTVCFILHMIYTFYKNKVYSISKSHAKKIDHHISHIFKNDTRICKLHRKLKFASIL